MVEAMGVGESRSHNGDRAIEESIAAATRHMSGRPDFVLSWVTEGYDPQSVAETVSGYAPVTCGCSVWGAITPKGVLTRGIVSIALKLHRPVIGPVVAPLDGEDRIHSGHTLGNSLFEQRMPSRWGLGIVFMNSSEHGDDFVAGLYRAVGPRFPLFGCATWDAGWSGYVFSNGTLVEHGALAFALEAVGRVEPVARHGWTPLSPPSLATRAADGELLLDGKPAWDRYVELLPSESISIRAEAAGDSDAGTSDEQRVARQSPNVDTRAPFPACLVLHA